MSYWRSGLLASAVFAAALGSAAAATAPLTGHVPDAVATHRAVRLRTIDPATTLTIAVALPMRNEAALDALLKALYDPASPQYRHYLSVAEFADRFGPLPADYAALITALRGAGLTITGISANRYIVDVQGRAGDIARAFHTSIGVFRHPTENRLFFAPDQEPAFDLAAPLLHVVGLDNYELPKPRITHVARATETGTGSGPGGQYLGSDIRAAYYGNGPLTGKGQSIGLMELSPYIPSDITLYFNTFVQPLTVKLRGESTDGTPATCKTCNDIEQAADIEYAISMAPGLDQVVIYVAQSAESVLNRMASDNSCAQLSTSWGWKIDLRLDEPLFKEMAAQGQTLLTASGDYSSLFASGQWPEESANITAVGGTDLVTKGPGGAWQSETGWSGSAGGPSFDPAILIESYQLPFINTANRGSTIRRNVPDIAADANGDNEICYNGGCFGGWGGTSFASPIWSGFIALANEKAANAKKPRIGFLNPTLYALAGSASYAAAIHDVPSGTSGKYRAVKGYDLVTGIGSPAGQALLNYLVP